MHRPRPTFWIATATVAALALGGGVAAARDGSSPGPSGRTHVEDGAHREDDATTSTSSPVPAVPVTPPTTVEDHGNDPAVPVTPPTTVEDHGNDDPATHDLGDDHGNDDPATHDVGDDHGGDRSGSNRGPGSGGDTTDDGGHGGSGHD